MLLPGEVYLADIPDAGRRPVIVVSRAELNRGTHVVVVVLTSAHFRVRSQLPNNVPFRAGEFGLSADCVAQAESISRISVDWIDSSTGPLGILTDEALRDVIRAIGNVLDADCEPI